MIQAYYIEHMGVELSEGTFSTWSLQFAFSREFMIYDAKLGIHTRPHKLAHGSTDSLCLDGDIG